MTSVPSLEELLAPVDAASFRREHLDRHALRLPARDLGAFADLDPVAVASAARGHVDVIRGGLATPLSSGEIPSRTSLRVRRVQRLHDTIERFAHGLASALREEVNVNLYLSPDAETAGLAPHTDPYDLFVLQLRGTKRWELLGDPSQRLEDATLSTRKGVTVGTRGELALEPGEVLYLPRGLLHRAHNAGPEPSIHLAVSILVKTMRSCIAWLAAELERRLDAARPLPLGGGRGDYDAAIAELHASAEAILSDPERVAAFLAHREVAEYEGLTLSPEEKRARPQR